MKGIATKRMERCFGWKGYEAARCFFDGCHENADYCFFFFQSSQYFNEKTSNYHTLPFGKGSVGGGGFGMKVALVTSLKILNHVLRKNYTILTFRS